MLGSIYIGLSGMNAFSKGLQTISNNVANMNTLGFKATQVNFADVFNSGGGWLGSASGLSYEQSGTGVRVGQPSIDFKQGELRASSGSLDLAVDGSGFLMLLDGAQTFYTRTGQFVVDDTGYISLSGTDRRLGVIGADGKPGSLNIDGKRVNPPVATTKIVFADNLSSTATDATVSSINVYDSAGAKQVWQVKLTPVTGATGQWTVTVTNQTGKTMGTSTIKFIGGVIDPSSATLTITDTPTGADPLSVVLDFSSGVTSYSSGTVSSLRAASVDGAASGALSDVTVDADGKVKLSYGNGKTELLGAVALVDFRDPAQLKQIGDGLFEYKGFNTPRVVSSGAAGVGKLVSKQLEASNVDLSAEFGELILIQRGFQAASQVVSISNDMIQQLFGVRGQG
jgi:flagellar hook protein FlgE